MPSPELKNLTFAGGSPAISVPDGDTRQPESLTIRQLLISAIDDGLNLGPLNTLLQTEQPLPLFSTDDATALLTHCYDARMDQTDPRICFFKIGITTLACRANPNTHLESWFPVALHDQVLYGTNRLANEYEEFFRAYLENEGLPEPPLPISITFLSQTKHEQVDQTTDSKKPLFDEVLLKIRNEKDILMRRHLLLQAIADNPRLHFDQTSTLLQVCKEARLNHHDRFWIALQILPRLMGSAPHPQVTKTIQGYVPKITADPKEQATLSRYIADIAALSAEQTNQQKSSETSQSISAVLETLDMARFNELLTQNPLPFLSTTDAIRLLDNCDQTLDEDDYRIFDLKDGIAEWALRANSHISSEKNNLFQEQLEELGVPPAALPLPKKASSASSRVLGRRQSGSTPRDVQLSMLESLATGERSEPFKAMCSTLDILFSPMEADRLWRAASAQGKGSVNADIGWEILSRIIRASPRHNIAAMLLPGVHTLTSDETEQAILSTYLSALSSAFIARQQGGRSQEKPSLHSDSHGAQRNIESRPPLDDLKARIKDIKGQNTSAFREQVQRHPTRLNIEEIKELIAYCGNNSTAISLDAGPDEKPLLIKLMVLRALTESYPDENLAADMLHWINELSSTSMERYFLVKFLSEWSLKYDEELKKSLQETIL